MFDPAGSAQTSQACSFPAELASTAHCHRGTCAVELTNSSRRPTDSKRVNIQLNKYTSQALKFDTFSRLAQELVNRLKIVENPEIVDNLQNRSRIVELFTHLGAQAGPQY
jgi:hypothetical protein